MVIIMKTGRRKEVKFYPQTKSTLGTAYSLTFVLSLNIHNALSSLSLSMKPQINETVSNIPDVN